MFEKSPPVISMDFTKVRRLIMAISPLVIKQALDASLALQLYLEVAHRFVELRFVGC